MFNNNNKNKISIKAPKQALCSLAWMDAQLSPQQSIHITEFFSTLMFIYHLRLLIAFILSRKCPTAPTPLITTQRHHYHSSIIFFFPNNSCHLNFCGREQKQEKNFWLSHAKIFPTQLKSALKIIFVLSLMINCTYWSKT